MCGCVSLIHSFLLFITFSFWLFQTIFFLKTETQISAQQIFLSVRYATTLLCSEIPRSVRYCSLLSVSFHGQKHCSFTLSEKNSPSTLLKMIRDPGCTSVACLFLEKASFYDHILDSSKLHIMLFLHSSFLTG